jgi:hypothetical protein
MRVAILFVTASALSAQSTPEDLARVVVDAFVAGSQAEFDAVYPFAEGRTLLEGSLRQKLRREAGLAIVADKEPDRALLLLAAGPVGFNSGDETSIAAQFADRYEARRDGARWKLSRRIPIADGNRILGHKLDVEIKPQAGIRVSDHLKLRIDGPFGFAARLNRRAVLDIVLVNGKPAAHHFGAGLLWVSVPQNSAADLRLDYRIDVEKGPDNWNSARFLEHAGHLRNQYYWHPFFGFGEPDGAARFDITARIPAAFQLSTSLPQTSETNGDIRTVRASSIRPTEALTLAYDRDWKVRSITAGSVRLDIFATEDFEPAPEKIAVEFRSAYELLQRRFGAPSGGYFAIVQGRSRAGSGWHNIANQAIFAGVNGGRFLDAGSRPRAPFHHEVAHAWTSGAAPADHFLTEGWATYVESIFLRESFGDDASRRFWTAEANAYFGAHDGKSHLLRDPENRGVAYHKGAWIFRMLEQQMGVERFDRAIAEFSKRSLATPVGAQAFMDIFEASQPGLRRFLTPWIEETSAPRLHLRIAGNTVTISQLEPLFTLPLDLDVQTAAGKVRKSVRLTGREVTVDAGSAVSSVVLDPDWKLLLRRD